MVKAHFARNFRRHIFSDSQYPKLLNANCKHSGCGGFIVSGRVDYVTYDI